MSQYCFIHPTEFYPLPSAFHFADYIETEQELWALFPETEGRRVNFAQLGLTAQLYAEVLDDQSELGLNETYMLMPCQDRTMRPIRMQACRRLTLDEYRMAHFTSLKLMGHVASAAHVIRGVGQDILGEEVLNEAEAKIRESQ